MRREAAGSTTASSYVTKYRGVYIVESGDGLEGPCSSESLYIKFNVAVPSHALSLRGRVSRQPGATTTLEPTFAFKRAVYDA